MNDFLLRQGIREIPESDAEMVTVRRDDLRCVLRAVDFGRFEPRGEAEVRRAIKRIEEALG